MRGKAIKRIFQGLILIALVLLISQTVEARGMPCQDLVTQWRAFQRWQAGQGSETDRSLAGCYLYYVIGVREATQVTDYFSFPSGVMSEQVCNVVGKYLDTHPERWHEDAIFLVFDALNQAFPKVPTKNK